MAARGIDPKMMRQLQQMQAQISKAQQELEESTIEASAGGGAVTVVVTGQPKIKSIAIAPEVVDPGDVEMLQDLIVAALNEALDNIRTMQIQRMGALTGGLDIPGLT